MTDLDAILTGIECKQMRQALGLSFMGLSGITGVPASSIRHFESGSIEFKHQPHRETLRRVMREKLACEVQKPLAT